MAKLTSKARAGLSPSSFALPGGRYPIEDESHARNALARGSQNASQAEQSEIKSKVRSRFPDIEVGGKPAPPAVAKSYAEGGHVITSPGTDATDLPADGNASRTGVVESTTGPTASVGHKGYAKGGHVGAGDALEPMKPMAAVQGVKGVQKRFAVGGAVGSAVGSAPRRMHQPVPPAMTPQTEAVSPSQGSNMAKGGPVPGEFSATSVAAPAGGGMANGGSVGLLRREAKGEGESVAKERAEWKAGEKPGDGLKKSAKVVSKYRTGGPVQKKFRLGGKVTTGGKADRDNFGFGPEPTSGRLTKAPEVQPEAAGPLRESSATMGKPSGNDTPTPPDRSRDFERNIHGKPIYTSRTMNDAREAGELDL